MADVVDLSICIRPWTIRACWWTMKRGLTGHNANRRFIKTQDIHVLAEEVYACTHDFRPGRCVGGDIRNRLEGTGHTHQGRDSRI